LTHLRVEHGGHTETGEHFGDHNDGGNVKVASTTWG
jgi:hypothetical protein